MYQLVLVQKDVADYKTERYFTYDRHLKQQHKKISYPQGITQNEKPIRIDSLTKLDVADVQCMEYMSAGDSGTYLLSIDSLLPFRFPLKWQDWKLKGEEEKKVHS